ncbi:CU044_2847 family protein [Streptomyces sp. DSM 44915]|uniref:CU044_2847 family protein n=1 Tax=Streptomyces chisholmiae TaxID=3075540 RepID=A0ABU2JL50_9ACTN|nr:CU044_2847 family protein [Streptomyces sp. DSM 44915]MDT0265642.1 CU044_2847 family protein [Streptomyces sp. DSM 44915]
MSSEVTRVTLPDGTPVWARIADASSTRLPEQQPRGGYSDTGFAQRAAAQMESLRELIGGVAASVADGLRDARPDEVSVSFGIELTAKAGKIVGLLAEGEAKGAITVTLTWQGGPPPASGGDAA